MRKTFPAAIVLALVAAATGAQSQRVRRSRYATFREITGE